MSTVQQTRPRTLAGAILALALLSGCGTAVGVRHVGAGAVHEHLTRNVLSTGKPSAPAQQVLNRRGLAHRFKERPAEVLAELHADLTVEGGEDTVFALAELCFLHADQGAGPAYHLAAAVYAFAFLFPQGDATPPARLDPRLRLAADLYNRGLARGLSVPEGPLDLSPGVRELPFGSLEIEINEADLSWGSYRMVRFYPVAELDVVGLRNRYRRPGIGAPLAADLDDSGRRRTPASFRRVPADVKVALTAFLRMERPRQQLAGAALRGRLELYTSEDTRSVGIDGRDLPLEYESSSSLAFTLSEETFSGFDMAGFFRGVVPTPRENEGLLMLAPYRRGRIPVVLVHGTASSPGWWGNMLNELQNDPDLRDRFQFWLFRYASSTPIQYSAGLLGTALTRAVKELDPGASDPALRRMVVIGHSQGGLLAKLTVVDSGSVFWDEISERPIDDYELDPETHEVLERSLFFRPLPFVRRVIFMATPHRGSYLARYGLANALVRLVSFPVEFATIPLRLLESDEQRLAEAIADSPSSIHAMTPGAPFLVKLESLSIDDRVATHSIIGVRGDGPVEEGDDGIVKYKSAHIEGVESELVVRSTHSVQLNPLAIREVDRILAEHAGVERPTPIGPESDAVSKD